MSKLTDKQEIDSSLNCTLQITDSDIIFNDGGKLIFCEGYSKLIQDIERYLTLEYNAETQEGNRVYQTIENTLELADGESLLQLIEQDFQDALLRLQGSQSASIHPEEILKEVQTVTASYAENDPTQVNVRMVMLSGYGSIIRTSTEILTSDLTIRHLYLEV